MTNELSINELSTNEKRDLVAAASNESTSSLDSEIYRQIAIATNKSDYEHDSDTLRDQVYDRLLGQVGFDVDIDPATNSVRSSSSTESSDDETDAGSDWASPIAGSRSKELEEKTQERSVNYSAQASAGEASINSDDDVSDWPSPTASKRSAELEEGDD